MTPSARSRSSSRGDDLHRLREVVGARADVEADLARVDELGGERVDRVGEPALLAHGLEQPRGGQPAEDGVEHPQREAAVVVARQPEGAEADVDLLGLLALELQRRARRVRRRDQRRRGVDRPQLERVRRELDDRVVVDRAGRRDHDRAGDVALRVERGDLLDRRVADDRGAADDRAPQRVLAVDGAAEHVEDDVLRVVLVHRDLLEHDLALGVDVAEGGPPDHVGHDVERHRQVLVEHPRVDGGALLVRAGVELGAHAVEQLVDLGRPVARRAAEQHVLEEVREAGLGLRLPPRACAHEEPEGRGPHGRHDLRDDPQPRVELGQAVFGQARGP